MDDTNKDFMTKGDERGSIEETQKITEKYSANVNNIYSHNDFVLLQKFAEENNKKSANMETMEELLKRDKKREEDGFSKKIKVGRIPVGKGKILVVPVVEEEKLYHGNFEPGGDAGSAVNVGTNAGSSIPQPPALPSG